jgi:hypothetical protein
MKAQQIVAGKTYEGGGKSRIKRYHGERRFVISIDDPPGGGDYKMVTYRGANSTSGTTVTCHIMAFVRWADREVTEEPKKEEPTDEATEQGSVP